LICEECGRVSPREAKARSYGGAYYEGYCKNCSATTPWGVKKVTFWSALPSLFCCNCGHEAYPIFKGLTEVYLAPCSNCGGDTLWHADSIGNSVYCLSCSRREPVTFKVWLERAAIGRHAQSGDETKAYR
jgi:hypothetical protein